MKEEEKDPPADQEISLDEETDAVFQEIADADENVDELAEIRRLTRPVRCLCDGEWEARRSDRESHYSGSKGSHE